MINSAPTQTTRLPRCTVRSAVLAVGLCTAVLFSQSVLAQSSSTVTATGDMSITVEPGDTFSSIVARELKSLDAWGEIARYNELESPDSIKPGDVILIPEEILRERNFATVVFVKGTAIHHDNLNNSETALTKGARIFPGDMIETKNDGFVSMAFNGGSTVNIQPESRMKIDVLDCIDRDTACEIELDSEKGQLGLDVKGVGFDKPTVFNIRTPYASAAVRGTRFDFDIDDGNILGVTEGVVEIELNGATNSIEIGKGVLAGEGRSLDELFDLLAQPRLAMNDDVTLVSSQDIINWRPLTNAANYLITVSPVESMVEVQESFTETRTFFKPEFSAGELFISARGVAANGLRGFTNKKKLVAVGIDENVEPVDLELIVSEDVMEITAPGASGDEIEVKIGNSLENIESVDYIVGEQILRMEGGETLSLDIDRNADWYIQAREVVNENTVSPYGLLYFFEKEGG